MSLRAFSARVVAQLLSSVRAVVQRDRLELEMEMELTGHLECLTADLIRAGHSPSEAKRRARIALGTMTVAKEGMRASLGLRWWDELGADLQYSIRMLRKSPGFTAIAAISLALAIGVNTTIFSLAKSLLFDRLNVSQPEELRMLRWSGDGNAVVQSMWGDFDTSPNGITASVFSYPAYLQLRRQGQVMQDLLAFKEDTMNVTVQGIAQETVVAMVSGNYFAVLGVQPQLGRNIQSSDDLMSAGSPVAVISDRVWEHEFHRSASALGHTINVNQSLLTIVGVAPRTFTGTQSVQSSPDVFVPLSLQPLVDPKGNLSLLEDSDMWWVNIVGRTTTGVSDAKAQAGLNLAMATAIRATMPMKAGDTVPQLSLADGSRGLQLASQTFKKPISVLMGLAGFVLLLACVNIANLLLARGVQRQRELSVRLALGAGRGRILRQLLTESLLLAGIGGAGGLFFGYLGRNLIPKLMTNAWSRDQFNVSMDWGVFAFSAGVTLLTGLAFGLAPAWVAASSEAGSSLKEITQTTTRRRKGLGGKTIVAFQIALSTLLVVSAGLFLRTFLALGSIDVGFRTDHLVLFEVAPPKQHYGPGKAMQLHQRLEREFAQLPGVQGVTPSMMPYIADKRIANSLLLEGQSDQNVHNGTEDVNMVGNTFFETMGIPMSAGRSFGSQDIADSPKVAIINEALAKKRFPNTNPVGKRFKTGEEKPVWVQVVGICADTYYSNLRDVPPPQFFMPYVQQPDIGRMTYAIRTELSPRGCYEVVSAMLMSLVHMRMAKAT